MERNTLKILLADDHGLFRDSMAVWLQQHSEKTVVVFAHDRDSLCTMLRQTPDILLLDLRMPGMKGTLTIAEIHQQFPQLPILVVSAVVDSDTSERCLQSGAKGYITKSSSGQEILAAVDRILSGRTYKPAITHGIASSVNKLNDRQLQLLEYLTAGNSNKQIAEKMFLSEGTVKQYVSQLLRELNVDNRTQAANLGRNILGQ